jgi:hypothetical protein
MSTAIVKNKNKTDVIATKNRENPLLKIKELESLVAFLRNQLDEAEGSSNLIQSELNRQAPLLKILDLICTEEVQMILIHQPNVVYTHLLFILLTFIFLRNTHFYLWEVLCQEKEKENVSKFLVEFILRNVAIY